MRVNRYPADHPDRTTTGHARMAPRPCIACGKDFRPTKDADKRGVKCCSNSCRRSLKDPEICAMYALYLSGKSVAEVATAFDRHRQNVHALFVSRGFLCRQKNLQPFVMYQGEKYSLSSGYYVQTVTGERLHRRIWTDTNGPIPDGCEIHHKDSDKANNAIENLECLTKSDHSSIPKKPSPIVLCAQCGGEILRTMPGRRRYAQSTLVQRKFCCKRCAYDWRTGKSIGGCRPGRTLEKLGLQSPSVQLAGFQSIESIRPALPPERVGLLVHSWDRKEGAACTS